jgi:hypothetical protein
MRVTRTIGVGERVDHVTFTGCRRRCRTATGVITLPHASWIVGGVGAVASAGQFTVEAPSAGSTKSGMSIV